MDNNEDRNQRILEEIRKHAKKSQLEMDSNQYQTFVQTVTESVNTQLVNGVRYFRYITASEVESLKKNHCFDNNMFDLNHNTIQNYQNTNITYGRSNFIEDEEVRKILLYMKLPDDEIWNNVCGLKGLFRQDSNGSLCFVAEITEETFIVIPCYCYMEELTQTIVDLLCSCKHFLTIAGYDNDGLFAVKGIHLLEEDAAIDNGMEVPLNLSDTFLQTLINTAAGRFNLSKEFSMTPYDRSEFSVEELYYIYCIEKVFYTPTLQKWIERSYKELFNKDVNLDSNERHQLLNALRYVVTIDWKQYLFDFLSIDQIKGDLDERFYGMQKVKQQVLEVLAFIHRTYTLPKRGILLYGPVGVGKESLAKAIAEILDEPVAVIELSTINDDKALNGTSRLYSNGTPGLILKHLNEHGTANMVMVLNDIDKATDPSFFLQLFDNMGYTDNYIETKIPTDGIFFIATCNEIDRVNQLVLDKFYRINVPAYSITEKEIIFDRYIYPRLLESANVWENEIQLTPGAKRLLKQEYALEPGLQDIERYAQKIIDYHILKTEESDIANAGLEEGNETDLYIQTVVDEDCLRSLLGAPKPRNEKPATDPGTVISGFIQNGVLRTFELQVLISPGEGVLRMINIESPHQKGFCQIAFECVRARFSSQMKEKDIVLSANRPLPDTPHNYIGFAVCAAIISSLALIKFPERSMFWGGCDLMGNLYSDDAESDSLGRYADGNYITVYAAAGTSLMACDSSVPERVKFVEFTNIDEFRKIFHR